MSRHTRTPDIPTCAAAAQPTRCFSLNILIYLGTFLALAGATAAAAAALFSIIPSTSLKVDPAMRAPDGPLRPARLVGLDHSGGDLRRAPRLTRRARRLGFGTPWTDGAARLPRQSTHSVLVAST